MRIVLIGAKGKLGSFLKREWADRHDLCSLTREDVELGDGDGLRRRLGEEDFEALVNCAAMASPEGCEDDPGGAELVNVVAPGVMAELCAERGAKMVHFSTDYVVDGREEGLKDESAAIDPAGHYGRSKFAGEERVLDRHPEALVCRVSWIFGRSVPSFLETIVARARRGEELSAVADKWSKPTSVAEISRVVEEVLIRGGLSGVLHLANAGEPVSWWGYACRVLDLAREAGLLDAEIPVRRLSLAEIPQMSAPRPVHTALESRRLQDFSGFELPHWEAAASERLREIAAGECH